MGGTACGQAVAGPGRLLGVALLAVAASAVLPLLPPAPRLAAMGLVVPLVLGLLAAELGRGLPGMLHLARARLGLRATAAPRPYVRALFDGYARHYDRHLFGALDYRVPNLLRDIVEGRVGRQLAVADLGCGTGALAPLFRRLARRLVGVDLSPLMLERARARGLYDELVEADLTEFLARQQPAAFDLLLLGDVMPYVGRPGPLLAAAARALRPGGRLALTIEEAPGAAAVRLTASGRFAHGVDALAEAAAALGIAMEDRRRATLRSEAGAPVMGSVLLFRTA